MLGKLSSSLQRRERAWRQSFGKDIVDPRARRWSVLHYEFVDHAVLRRFWHNFFEVAPGVYRSNHPNHRRFAAYKAMGIKSVLNLRGTPRRAHHLFEVESCAALGLALHNTELHARKPAARDKLLRLFDLFRSIERPFVMHCKSGADRAGLASALYLMAFEDVPVAEARKQLSIRYLHLKSSKTGVLDHMLDLYEARVAEGPIGIEDWIATEYDPDAVMASFQAKRSRR
ncbi:MAG: dual specificity protein phosphatase family protein [Rhodobacterales bacterium]|nr:dual specificity protein phosphatase family protein [Rhodobacterales bacterium]